MLELRHEVEREETYGISTANAIKRGVIHLIVSLHNAKFHVLAHGWFLLYQCSQASVILNLVVDEKLDIRFVSLDLQALEVFQFSIDAVLKP